MMIDPKDERIRELEQALGACRDYLGRMPTVPVTLHMIREIDEALRPKIYPDLVYLAGERRATGGLYMVASVQVIGTVATIQSGVPESKARRLWEVMNTGLNIQLERRVPPTTNVLQASSNFE
jgi:hypothetical protein